MGMLDSLLGGVGQGLRAGSGVLNEQVFQNNEQLRQNQMQAAEARKAKMFEYVWQGVQSGSIQPQQGLQAMAQIDPAATQQIVSTLGGGVGPGLEAQQSALKYQRMQQEQQASDALAKELGLPPGTPANVVAKAYAVKNPAPGRADTKLVTLTPPRGGSPRTFRQGDPQVDALTGQGWTLYQKPGTSVNINTAGETAFSKEFGKIGANQVGSYLDAGENAGNMERGLVQLSELMSRGVPQGALQPPITLFQGIADDLGVDIGSVAKSAGVNVGKLGEKEEFDRLATALTIEGFEKFKGNLNQQEVRMAREAFPQLGKSEQGNRMAVASLLASARLVQERAAEAAQVGSVADLRAFEANKARSGSKRFEQLRSEILSSMPSAGQQAQPQGGKGQLERFPDGSAMEPDGKGGFIFYPPGTR